MFSVPASFLSRSTEGSLHIVPTGSKNSLELLDSKTTFWHTDDLDLTSVRIQGTIAALQTLSRAALQISSGRTGINQRRGQYLPSMANGRLAVTILTLFSLAFCAMAARDLSELFPSTPPVVPASIEVPHYQLVQTVFAKGHQFYRFNGTAWLQFNAMAKLYNRDKHEVGSHFFLPKIDALGGQPTWQSLPSKGVPFSSVTCKPVSSAVVDEESILWVLLETTQSEGDRKYFGEVAFVQRYKTKGGLAPTSKEAPVGAIKKSRYTSLYSFYVKSNSHHY